MAFWADKYIGKQKTDRGVVRFCKVARCSWEHFGPTMLGAGKTAGRVGNKHRALAIKHIKESHPELTPPPGTIHPNRVVEHPTDAEYLAKWKKDSIVNANGCWIWQRFRHSKGYGETSYRGKSWRVHRIIHIVSNGPLSDPKNDVCHRCDTPSCINPAHLFEGTRKENLVDSLQKGRHYRKNMTHCKRGHEFTPDNTYRCKIGRHCKTCDRAKNRIRAGWPEELWYAPIGTKWHPKYRNVRIQLETADSTGKG